MDLEVEGVVKATPLDKSRENGEGAVRLIVYNFIMVPFSLLILYFMKYA